ncbi:L-ribulose-5-phosphate 4-epimerase [Enterococcus sp. DIV2402]|uniref:L-ribulose-5-phosphate 4-epimerase n=2 Tax=Candidatus Enterococcus lowellii TaxID=2230877 RepID=A0ABZ2SR11_9ENTE
MNREQIILEMKQRVFEANLTLPKEGLIKLTWGNVSEINRKLGVIVIKPSGVSYDTMCAEEMVVTDLNGNLLEKESLNPSSDLATHVVLYKSFEKIGAIVHTHSTNAVKWAQARRDIPAYGTTHADTFYGSIPCTRQLTREEIESEYEKETGKVIVETFKKRNIEPLACPAVIVYGHGPFTWGETVEKAVQNSVILDEVASMALGTEQLKPTITAIDSYLLDKHYYRKHGVNAYYGQN